MILERYRELARDLWPGSRAVKTHDLHLREALAWIYRAQDATPDRGVSHSYRLGGGWQRSYPETTGYIIPTLLNWAARSGEDEARRRALEMAEWETTVQLPDGGVPSLVDGKAVIFDTGQVLFGFLAAHRETRDDRFRQAAVRAANWLTGSQDADGVWHENGRARVYNARTSWALIESGRCLEHASYTEAGRRFLMWTLGEEDQPGWFGSNCLNDDDRPLLHTIAYTAQGQLEAGILLEENALIEAARRTARALAANVGPSGRMAGRFDRTWKPAAGWACLTGMAQTVIVWRRLDAWTGSREFEGVADRALGFLLAVQDVSSRNGGLRGGVRGSHPVNGQYCRYLVPNWATKFFLDALLLDRGSVRYPG